ncbi:MAG: SRPBCC family protein [Verrucomicrobiota bacterium]
MNQKPMLKIILIAIPAIIVVFVIIVAMQPSSYRVTRSLAINAPPETLFPHINELKKWEVWNPWGKADPNMKLTYGEKTTGVGANYSWAGNREVGEGRLTIAESRPSESVRYKMEFFKPMSGSAEAEFTFKAQGNQTEVTWTVTGEKDFMSKAFCLFMSMDKMLGGKFEKALMDLKTIAESPAK